MCTWNSAYPRLISALSSPVSQPRTPSITPFIRTPYNLSIRFLSVLICSSAASIKTAATGKTTSAVNAPTDLSQNTEIAQKSDKSDKSEAILSMLVSAVLEMDARMKRMEEMLEQISLKVGVNPQI